MRQMLSRALIAGLLGVLFASPARAVSLSLVPATTTASVGDSVAIAIEIAGLGAGMPPTLSSFDVDVSFDPSVLSFQNVVFGSALGSGADVFTSSGVLSGPTRVNVAEASLLLSSVLDAAQPASFVLATLSFLALGPGTSPLAIGQAILADTSDVPGGNQIFVDQFGSASVMVQSAPVPEPAALLVFGAGVLVVGAAPGYWRKR